MSEESGLTPSDEELSEWIRDHPDVWVDAARSDQDGVWPESVVNIVLARERARQRRRRKFVAGAAVAAVVTTGAVGAAALLRSGQPGTPEAGPACRAAARLDADAIVLAVGAEPIAGCLALWETGAFAAYMTEAGVPPLTACIGANGAIEVFPGQPDVCAQLGLAPADPTLEPQNQAVISLHDDLVESINSAGCVPVEEAIEIARKALDSNQLGDWTVIFDPANPGNCAKTAVDSPNKQVVISEI